MGAYASVPTCVTWLANNLSGQTKRGIGMGKAPLSFPLFLRVVIDDMILDSIPNWSRKSRSTCLK
jgi:hypothetical protein